jgi:predicted ATPase/DNA-binding CsgD family transcriptional regulator
MVNAKGIHKLTPREREVLRALATGLSTKEVAAELGLTIETVRSYTKTAYAALGIHNRAEATRAAVEAGLLDLAASPADERANRREAIARPIRPVIGRDAELAILAERLAEHRLVSIVGIGGAGKTVLAREAARARLAAADTEGAFVLLEHVDGEVGLAMAIADAVGIHLQRARADAWNEVARLADDKPWLLVLDNLEHLLDCADRLVGILDALPSLRLLATSRQPLGLAEEVVVRIHGLSVPPDRLASAQRHGAVELFVREVERIDAERELGPSDLAVIGDICRRVGGLPLAVVLAAGWTDVLSLEEIAADLTRASDLLTSESLVPPRHRSLIALVDDSIDRRPLEQQQALARMSVFDGGFDRAAATVVAGATLQDLAALIRASLVRHDPDAGRYDLHPLVRERAAARLEGWHETATTRASHRDHYTSYVSGWADAMAGRREPPGQREAIEAIEREYGNIREAWLHAAATGHADAILAMVHTVAMCLDHRSDLMECDQLLSAALDSPLIAELHWPRLWLHREYIRLQSGAIDPATSRTHEALAAIETGGIDWRAPAEIITAFLEFAALDRVEDAFGRVQRLTAPDADAPAYWRHRGQMLLGFILAVKGEPELAVDAHRRGMQDALDAGDYSGAHVQSTFLSLGLLRVNRRESIAQVLTLAEEGLKRLPHEQTEASLRLIRFILAVFDGEDLDALEMRLDDPKLARIMRENPHLAILQAGAMGLAWGARGDREVARRQRDAIDESVASGFFPESVLWAELGLALAAAAHRDFDRARAHANNGRSWEQRAALVTREVDTVLRFIEAVAAAPQADRDPPSYVLDEAISRPSLLSTLLRDRAAPR